MRIPFLKTGGQGLYYLRYIVAGEVARARKKLGGLVAAPKHFADMPRLSVTQNMEPAPRFEKAQHAAWALIARGHEIRQPSRANWCGSTERFHHCLREQQSEFWVRRESNRPPATSFPKPHKRPWNR